MTASTTTAVYPLTVFDGPNGQAGLFIGWLVEGLLDFDKIELRLRDLVRKWPLLAGRIEEISKWKFNIIVPLGDCPEGYSTFRLTSNVSETPITEYTEIPLPIMSKPLPQSLFMQPDHPIIAQNWVTRNLPLLHWHLTFFKQPGQEYTCIGLVLPHLLADGPGFGVLLRRIENEMLGQAWDAPPALHPGHNQNKLQVFFDEVESNIKSGKRKLKIPSPSEYPTITLAGPWFLFKFLSWHIWQRLWHKSETRFIHIPRDAVQKLVDETNKTNDPSTVDTPGEVTTLSMVDILTAWIYKTVYSEETSLGCRTNLVNMDYSRLAPDLDKESYIHNCFTPVQYPVLKVAELKSMTVCKLAMPIAHAKSQTSLSQSIYTYELLQACTRGSMLMMVPKDGVNSDEAITISNMTAANMVRFDWSGVGSKRMVGCTKGVLVHIPVLMANVIVIAGECEDGRVVVQATLGAKRMKALEKGVLKLIEQQE